MRTHDFSDPNMQEIKEASGTVVQNVCTLAPTARVSRYPHVDPTLPATVNALIDKTHACFFAEQIMGLELGAMRPIPQHVGSQFHACTSFIPSQS